MLSVSVEEGSIRLIISDSTRCDELQVEDYVTHLSGRCSSRSHRRDSCPAHSAASWPSARHAHTDGGTHTAPTSGGGETTSSQHQGGVETTSHGN